ncbi:GNAT family N-acetyltransferase [bacterium SCSIO 12741]|nr:GNAT family N-acetyltransferase [bacterium SCSIO 12741]
MLKMESLKITPTHDYKTLARLNAPLQNLHAQLYPKVFKSHNLEATERELEQFLSQYHWFAFMATWNEEAIGYLLCFIQQRSETAFRFAQKNLYIDQIYVQESFRRKQVGRKLMDSAIELARKEGIQSLQLNHWNLNEEAGRSFEKMGFHYYNRAMQMDLPLEV